MLVNAFIFLRLGSVGKFFMRRFYEVLYVLPGSKLDKDIEEERMVFQENIRKFGGKIIESQNWGLRTLAYEIDGNRSGYYFLDFFELESTSLNSLIKSIASLPRGVKVIRYIFVATSKGEFEITKSFRGEIQIPEKYKVESLHTDTEGSNLSGVVEVVENDTIGSILPDLSREDLDGEVVSTSLEEKTVFDTSNNGVAEKDDNE